MDLLHYIRLRREGGGKGGADRGRLLIFQIARGGREVSWARRFFLVGHHQTCSLSPFPPPFNPHPHRLKYANEHCSTRFVRSAAGLFFLPLPLSSFGFTPSSHHHPNERDGQTFRSRSRRRPKSSKICFPHSFLSFLVVDDRCHISRLLLIPAGLPRRRRRRRRCH